MNIRDSALNAAEAYSEAQSKRGTSSVPTPRQFILEALGCHKKAEPDAYFEYENLYEILKQSREIIETAGGTALERIVLKPETWLEGLTQLLDPLSSIPTPALPTLRPGCDPSRKASTCRMPTVGVVSVAFFALTTQPKRPLIDTLERLNLTPFTQSFAILKMVDPEIRDAPIPEALNELRDRLTSVATISGGDSGKITARLLHQIAEQYSGVAVEDIAKLC